MRGRVLAQRRLSRGADLEVVRRHGDAALAQARTPVRSVEGIAEVETIGGFEKQYQVEIDPERLLAYNVPISKVVSAIRSANNDVGGRELEQNGTTYLVRGKGYIQDLEALRLVVVGSDANGTP